MFVFRN